MPSWTCALANFAVPIVVVAIFQVKFKSLWDFHAGMTGTLKALVATYVSDSVHFIYKFRILNSCKAALTYTLLPTQWAHMFYF